MNTVSILVQAWLLLAGSLGPLAAAQQPVAPVPALPAGYAVFAAEPGDLNRDAPPENA